MNMTSLAIQGTALYMTIQKKKVLGKFKDECAGVPIAEYIGLRPKPYSILRANEKVTDEKVIKKAKGVKNM